MFGNNLSSFYVCGEKKDEKNVQQDGKIETNTKIRVHSMRVRKERKKIMNVGTVRSLKHMTLHEDH